MLHAKDVQTLSDQQDSVDTNAPILFPRNFSPNTSPLATTSKNENTTEEAASSANKNEQDVQPQVNETKTVQKDSALPAYQTELNGLTLEEQLKSAVDASIEVEQNVDFNHYRILDWKLGDYKNVNPYALDVVPFFDRSSFPYLHKGKPSLYSTKWFSEDTTMYSDLLTQTDPIAIFIAVRNNAIRKYPELATHRWDDLPDPPEMLNEGFLSTITDLNLDYVINERNEIKTPDKLKVLQDKKSNWSVKGSSSLQFSQSKTSEYWESGDQDYFSLLGIGIVDANYTKTNLSWENHGEVRLGFIYQSENQPFPMRKNEDRFRIGTKFGYKTNKMKKWYYTVNFDLNTQLLKGFTYNDDGTKDVISNFFSPATGYLSLGMEYKKDKKFTLFLSPLTQRFTYLLDTTNIDVNYRKDKYGLEKDEKITHQFGGYIKSSYSYNITKQVEYQSKLYLFIDYTQFPLKWDIDWENVFNFQLTHLLSAKMSLHFIYDDNVKFDLGEDADGNTIYGKRLQFKEFMSFGFNYKF